MDDLSLNMMRDVKLHDDKYEYINVFKNPNHLPINQIHLERITVKLKGNPKQLSADSVDEVDKCLDKKQEIVRALDKSWVSKFLPIYRFIPYNFDSNRTNINNNKQFEQNRYYLETLNYLLNCNYHQFWCTILFERQIVNSLHSFILDPLQEFEVTAIALDEHRQLYRTVFNRYLMVYKRLITFKQSDIEFMSCDIGVNYLIDNKLLNLPIIITLISLYEKIDLTFVNQLTQLYFCDRAMSTFQLKEIEEFINQVAMTLEMIGGHVCGFDKSATIIPIAIERRPKTFNLTWIYSVLIYLFNTINSLHVLLKYDPQSIEIGLDKEIPYRISFTYERVYFNLYELLSGRKEIDDPDNRTISALIRNAIALGRYEFIEVYYQFVANCLAKTLEFQDDPVLQQEHVEIYLKLMTITLDDEYFICDYNEVYDVEQQNEMFASCCKSLDTTRTDYIMVCINNYPRHNRLLKMKSLKKKKQRSQNNNEIEKSILNKIEDENRTVLSDKEIDDLIKIVVDMFPHLGDGFVLKCLEAYNFQTNEVIGAILEENLPPHIIDVPFDLIRIPPEPEPVQPILAYRGKKPNYTDALQLLNDKKDMKEIKTFIMDGMQLTNEYDAYDDDEYDDRLDEETVNVRDQGSEDILKYNPNYDELDSDTSYSENEYDDNGEVVVKKLPIATTTNRAFCEDPALIRARREAKYTNNKSGGGGGRKPPETSSVGRSNVVGKPKGQGQEKNVVHNRQNKNVHKSSRANHNRKSGAQWKRNKGMLPS